MALRQVPSFAICWSLVLFLLSGGFASAHKERVFEETLSSSPHEVDGQHDSRYDQDAFLGEDSQRFLRMTPEESKAELAKIFDKIDTNHDGYVTEDELIAWLNKIHNRTVVSDVRRTWENYELKPGQPLSWETYKRYMVSEDGEYADHDEESMESSLARDRRRWDQCSSKKDGILLYEEASCFLHPELHEHMKEYLAKETIEEIDKNGDGLISIDEYIADMWLGEKGESEPEWVLSEREEFRNKRDKNKDGQLDVAEVHDWIFPSQDDPIKSEAVHLISECDADSDERLSKQEMLDRYDFLVGHQLTNFGEVLGAHDEL